MKVSTPEVNQRINWNFKRKITLYANFFMKIYYLCINILKL